jgi:transposase InsO family protein
MGGNFVTKRKGLIKFTLPEFFLNRQIQFSCHIDDSTNAATAPYDMIIGRDLMSELALDISFHTHAITWEGISVPMKERGHLRDRETAHELMLNANEGTRTKASMSRVQHILDAQYHAADLNQVIGEVKTLNNDEQKELLKLLQSYAHLFDGTLGDFNTAPVSIELIPGAKPYHGRPYPVPVIHRETVRKEIQRLCDAGVLEKCNHSEHAAPTFIIPKKSGTVRVVSDFRRLNANIRRKPFPIPRIADLIQELEGFTYATALDLNMGYYTIRLDPDAQNLCTIIFPWGKYKYKRLPMGINCAPDIFQERMSDLMAGLDFVRTYLDDLLVISTGTFTQHLQHVQLVLQRLSDAGLRVNADKSTFCAVEIEYLGFWITRHGVRPMTNKIDAIQNIAPPNNRKQLRRFIGMVNYYRDMWIRRSDLLAPLTALTSVKTRWAWTSIHQTAFTKIKEVLSQEVLLAFPNFSKPFHVYTDASDNQLGAVIMQEDKPLAFYSRKLNSAQRRYTVTERELLSIVETLREFRNILLGQKLIVHTDHKNLTYEKHVSDRVMRWRLFLEEYGPDIRYIKGDHNIIADALSRLDIQPLRDSGQPQETAFFNTEQITFPVHTALIAHEQKKDAALCTHMLADKNKTYTTQTVEGNEVIMYKDKIYVPKTLEQRTLCWYHEYLCHPGANRTEQTIRRHLYWPGLTSDAVRHCKFCKTCQLQKKQRKKYGLLPPKEAEHEPWTRVCVDLVGPYTLTSKNGTKHSLSALTMIDPATGWFEIKAIATKTAAVIMDHFNNEWLCRYPRPQRIIFDNGGEFKHVFRTMCENYGIQHRPTTSYNPQANSVLERIHQVLGNMLRTQRIEDTLSIAQPWENFLAAAAWAIRSTYHTTLDATPGQLVFGRDMLLNIAFKANWEHIRHNKQISINASNLKENKSRIPHVYKVGDQITVTRPGLLPKLSSPTEGPHTITQVYTNGTVQILRGIVSQRINIRRIHPFFALAIPGGE